MITGAPRQTRKMRYRTFVVLLGITIAVAGILTTVFVAWLRPTSDPWRRIAISIGVGVVSSLLAAPAWWTNRDGIRAAGFERW